MTEPLYVRLTSAAQLPAVPALRRQVSKASATTRRINEAGIQNLRRLRTESETQAATGDHVLVDLVDRVVAGHAGQRGALLPVLHVIRRELGEIPMDAVRLVATALNLYRADVHGTIAFYHDFRQHPQVEHAVPLCRAEAYQARGCATVERAAVDRLGVRMEGYAIGGESVTGAGLLSLIVRRWPDAFVDGRPLSRPNPGAIEGIVLEIGA